VIIKGKSRAGPSQLARHLGRADTNERVELLELAWGGTSVQEAFRDWQVISEGTKGRLGLYHANIDPDAKYAMTLEQWLRAVEVLEEELGLQGQPRAIVMHEKNGREHIHVVWARTDMDTMKLRSDSMNYQAHERASLRLEQEFGHEHVPGKHAKRDREAQPEFPTAEAQHDEWQQGERGGMNHRERKAQVKGLYEASDIFICPARLSRRLPLASSSRNRYSTGPIPMNSARRPSSRRKIRASAILMARCRKCGC
jgi:hypothetical protein